MEKKGIETPVRIVLAKITETYVDVPFVSNF